MKKKIKKIEIPFFRQKTDYFCGPASLQMVFGYFNIRSQQEELARIMGTNEDFGTKNKEMIKMVSQHGLYNYTKDSSSLEDIDKMLSLGVPVIVNYMEPTDNESHYAVVSGATKDELILADPWNGNGFKITKKDFLKRWKGFEAKRWFLAVSDRELSFS